MKKKIMVAGFALAIAVSGYINSNKSYSLSSELNLANLLALNEAQAWESDNGYCNCALISTMTCCYIGHWWGLEEIQGIPI